MGSRMKVAVLTEPRRIIFEEREIPVPQEHEVLVKMKHVGICGSDLHYYEHGRIGNFVVEKPIVLGHESSGAIVAVGKQVTQLQAGDLVTLEPGYTCGKCEFCKKGLTISVPTWSLWLPRLTTERLPNMSRFRRIWRLNCLPV
jgi:L-iditol 2-dehydrogenase